jgi:ABC-type sugar transport system substrate-binding protein
VADANRHKIPLVIVDRPAKNAPIAVFSDNKQGGESAAEILREYLTGENTVLVCGPRNITSIFGRMDGFFKKAQSYRWQVAEVFTSAMNIKDAQQGIIQGLSANPDAEGLFLTNEHASLAYLDLVHKEKLPKTLYAVCYDINNEIARAIAEGSFVGTIFQDPPKIGSAGMQELLLLLQQQSFQMPATPKVVLVPVKKITKENLPSEWLRSKDKPDQEDHE